MFYPIGTRVVSHHGYEGVVSRVFDDLTAIEFILGGRAKNWVSAQDPPITQAERVERWYEVQVEGGGSLWSPESRLDPEIHDAVPNGKA
jgi:hypothetical protein